MNFIVRWLVTAVAAGAAVMIVPGITTVGSDSLVSVVAFALVLSLVNAVIKPVAQFFSFPLSIITLGVFYLIVNALLLELAASLSNGMFGSGIAVASFGSAFLGSIVISIVSAFVNGLIGDEG